jgi:hypothetical protein
MTSRPAMQTGRGGFLTAMAVLLSVAVAVDLLKALTKPPPPGHELTTVHRFRPGAAADT